jgi:hypothetical protein
MTLTALISAYHESSDSGDGLRASLPLAGRTLIERQARLAGEAGAKPIVIVVDRQPPELIAAFNRLRAEGLDILVAKNAAEAAKAVQATDRILLMADGLLSDENQVRRLVETDGAALLTVPDLRFDDRFERIDAESRWGGLAMIDGQILKHTAAMLQDWDLQSTLLRRAVQSGARHIGLGGDPSKARLIVAERASDLAELETTILESASAYQSDWVSRYLLAPLEQAVTRRLMPTNTSPSQLWLIGLVLTSIAAICFARGWLWAGLPLYLLATPFDGLGERLARLRMRGAHPDSWVRRMTPFAAAAAVLTLGYTLAGPHGWGCLVLGAATIAFLAALEGEGRLIGIPGSLFLAEHKGMGWLMLPFGATGQWVAGLGALALYAAGSFFWAQRHVRAARAGHLD